MRPLISCLCFTLFVSMAHATVIVPAEFKEIVGGSELIAHGRVLDVRPEWADGRRRIDSVVTVGVLSWFKGGNGQTLSFVVPGGEIGRYRNVLVGAPVFKEGDEAFVFLKARGDGGMPYVFGLNQGVFRVNADGRGARQVTSPALMATADAPETVRRGAVSRRPVPIDEFGTRIRSVMAVTRAGAR
jgi:hypothetical protein